MSHTEHCDDMRRRGYTCVCGKSEELLQRAAELLRTIKELGTVTMADENGREMIIGAASEWLKDAGMEK